MVLVNNETYTGSSEYIAQICSPLFCFVFLFLFLFLFFFGLEQRQISPGSNHPSTPNVDSQHYLYPYPIAKCFYFYLFVYLFSFFAK